MTNPRLSICIATYNRAEYIGETLGSIIPQLTDDAEIVIVDGASTDQTPSVVKRYRETCPQIQYVQLPAKGGVDQDFCKAVELARGEYCWLFPDDDLLSPGAVKAVLDECGKGYSLIVVNARVMNKDFSVELKSRKLAIDRNEVYRETEMEALFNRTVLYMSFIGAVVIRRDVWRQREKERYWGSEFVHIGVIFQSPLPAPALVIAEPYIMIRFGNAQWSPRAIDIWMFKWPELLSSFTHISKPIRQKYQMTNLRSRMKTLLNLRRMGAYSIKEYSRLLKITDPSIVWKFSAWSIAIIPVSCVDFLVELFRKFKRK